VQPLGGGTDTLNIVYYRNGDPNTGTTYDKAQGIRSSGAGGALSPNNDYLVPIVIEISLANCQVTHILATRLEWLTRVPSRWSLR
jgi:hypothetical protein